MILMNRVIIFLCLVCLWGCGSNQNKQIGPLNQLKVFQVALYAESNREVFLNHVVESLKDFGNVQIVNTNDTPIPSIDTSPALLISINGTQEIAEGSIRVFGEVAVQPNQCKIISQIWEVKDQRESLISPELENGKVSFNKKNLSTPSKDSSISAVVARIVTQFSQQYRKDNPGNMKPTFYIYEQVL